MRTFICALALACLLGDARAADTWTDPYPGVRRLHRVTASQNINVLVVDLCAAGVSVRATAQSERGRVVSSFGALAGAQAAINGDFYSAGYDTNGPSRGNGMAWGGADHGYVAPVQFGPGQVALPEHGGTGGVEPWAREVVSGHPTLLAGGQVRGNNGDGLCTARHPRTAIGFDGAKTKMFLAVIDGRATGRIGMTCDEMIGLFQGLGASDALNLDGGGSSTMWLGNAGVLNYPSDGQQRVVANHLAIRATGSGPAVHCPRPPYAADFAAKDAPLEMTSGDEAVTWLELVNKGSATWDITSTRIGTQSPQDRASPFFKAGNWLSPNRPTGADHSNYGPNATGRFSFVLLAPEVNVSTDYEEVFQAVQEGVTWFGPKMTLKIKVHPRSGPTDGSVPAPTDGGAADDAGGTPGTPGGHDAPPETSPGEQPGGCSIATRQGVPPLSLLTVLALGWLARPRRRHR
jgi:hypothetical protein